MAGRLAGMVRAGGGAHGEFCTFVAAGDAGHGSVAAGSGCAGNAARTFACAVAAHDATAHSALGVGNGRPRHLAVAVAANRGSLPGAGATLIAHELVHLERRDYLVRWLELAALGWYWWHPVAWWARRNLSAAQEQCCDARVLSLFPQSARAYAETLLATVEFLAEPSRPLPAGASGFSEFGHLHRRLTMILQSTPSRRVAWPLRASLLAFAVAVLPLSLHTLWADPAPPSPEEAVGAENRARRGIQRHRTAPGAVGEDDRVAYAEGSRAEHARRAANACRPTAQPRNLPRLRRTLHREAEKQSSHAHEHFQFANPGEPAEAIRFADR